MISKLTTTFVSGPNWVALLLAAASLGLSDSAKASIVTHSVNFTLNASSIESYDLDVDQNGTTDFTFTAAFVPDPFLSVGFDVVDFPFGSNNGVVIDAITGDGFPTVSRLAIGDVVAAGNTFSFASFDQGNLYFFTTFDPPSGNFVGETGYVGLRFDSPNGTLYGFAQVTVKSLNDPDNPLGLTIGAVGFNDVPGQAIEINAVPEPSSLLMAGVGGLACLAAFRRRR